MSDPSADPVVKLALAVEKCLADLSDAVQVFRKTLNIERTRPADSPAIPGCDWITSNEAAELIGCSPSTLTRWRTTLEDGKPVYGPTFKKNPGAANTRVSYRRSVVLKWVADQEVKSL